ncbi:MAG: response regulator, partial [Kiritimatiellae bacterium]|nr:response regulator [Kiritimatiellia bacterium]
CKRLVELAHGTLSIDTAPGKGFAIHVEVPVDVASDGQASGKDSTTGAPVSSNLPKRVFVVDDSPVNRAVLKALLTRLGVSDIELAEDGKAALEKLEADPAFDLVLSDMWMPVMDGAELVKRIRADERLAHLKVCSITADVEARMTYREQGFDMLLLKPVTIEKMVDLLNDLG